MTPARFTAFWLVGQFVLLVILYHAAPWPWASRGLSMLGALIPAWALLIRANPLEHGSSGAVSARDVAALQHPLLVYLLLVASVLAPIAAAINLALPLGDNDKVLMAYWWYVTAYIAAQCLLAICWYVWWRAGAPWPALGGGILAALGTIMSAYAHGQRSVDDILAMSPWRYMWEPGAGPIDVLSRVAPKLASVEVLVFGGASIALAVVAWRKG